MSTVGASADARRLGFLRRLSRSDHAAGWAFVTPATVLIGVFGLLPILWSLVLSFQKSDLLTPATPWVGLANYEKIPGDATFRLAIEHTIVYTALFVPATMFIGLMVAVGLNRKVRGISIYRTAAYVTMAVSTINEAIIFMWLFEPSFGVVNGAFDAVGLPQQQWLSNPDQALYVIMAMTVWGWTGFAVVVYLAALQSVPRGAARSRRDRWRQAIRRVPHDHPAVAQPGVALPRRVVEHQCATALR